MKPIYFPFTYVPQWVAETLTAWFKQFTVYQPSGRKLSAEMQPWVETNMMEVRVPVQTEDDALAKMVNDLQAYASLHDDSKHLQTAALGGRHGAIPFFGESAVSRIVTEVKKSSRARSAATDPDPLFCARVFLEFAHEYDRQSDELSQGLDVNDRRSRDLLKELGGKKENGLPATPLTAEIRVEDPAEYMALDRFQAWLRLYMIDPVQSGLFVTSSPSVFNHLIEDLAAAEKIIESEGLPRVGAKDDATTWRDSFLKKLKQLVENKCSAAHTFLDNPLPDPQRLNVVLTLYRVPGRPANLFPRIFQGQEADTARPDPGAEFTHTLIGLIARQPVKPSFF
jgi:hypothetical protein